MLVSGSLSLLDTQEPLLAALPVQGQLALFPNLGLAAKVQDRSVVLPG